MSNFPEPPIKRRPGRPVDPDSKRQTGKNLTIRVRGGMHEKLRQAAEQSERSLSEEVERRLEESFVNPTTAFFGSDPYGADLFLALSAAAKLTERFVGTHWTEDPRAARAMGEAFRMLALKACPLQWKLSERELNELNAFARAKGEEIAQACLVFLHVAADPEAKARGIDAAYDHPDLVAEVVAARRRDPATPEIDDEAEIDPTKPILSGVHTPRKKRLLDR